MRLLKYQETNKESGHWLLNNESDAFSTSYLWYVCIYYMNCIYLAFVFN